MKKFRFLSLFLIIAGAVVAGWLAPHLLQAAPLATNDMFGSGNGETFANTAGLASGSLVTMIANIIRIILGLLGLVAVVIIIYAGFLWTTAGGEEAKLEKAKKTLKNGIIGLVIIVFSFAIAQFVLSALTGSIGGGSTTVTDGSGDGDVPPDSSRYFYLSGTNINECAGSIQNLQLQFSFSQKVNLADLDGGISITKGGVDVAGTFAAVDGSTDSARSFTFTPTQTCTASDGSTVNCFDADAAYEVDVNSSLTSSSGYAIQCSLEGYSCSFDFVTGTGFDLAAPTLFEINEPSDGESVYSGEAAALQAHAIDDRGVSSVTFYLDGDEVDSVVAGSLLAENWFGTMWDTAGYVVNHDYDISAEGADCAGNSAEDQISVTLRAASCNNSTQDEGETGVDCGGDSSSDYYCGACPEDSCSADGDCASGSCVDGACVATVEISEVSPGDGAAGNLITISGNGFGTTEGQVIFLGDTSVETDDVSHSAYTGCANTWSDNQVIIQINTAALSGPIEIVTADGNSDRTDDENGPHISDFAINSTVRPGLCNLNPSAAEAGGLVAVTGNNFGESRGDSTLYFGSYGATSYENWVSEGTSFSAVSPQLDDATYRVQLFTGSGDARQGSNKLDFRIYSTTAAEPPVISQIVSNVMRCSDSSDVCVSAAGCSEGATCDEDDSAGPPGQYITIYGSNFGSSQGTVRFQDPNTESEAVGDASFPDECEGATWSDTEIVIKVPARYDIVGSGALLATTHRVWIVRGDEAVSEPVDFEVLSGEAAPGMCAIVPDSGPVGLGDVKIYGERMGSDGGVFFYQDKSSQWTEHDNNEISGIVVPDGTQTGPVYIIDDADIRSSNSLNFEVGNCEANSCAAGETCCASGACATECPATDHASHYAYYFSTGNIPDAPEIRMQCDATWLSPTPWDHWAGGTDVCLNAVIGVDFTENMDPDTFLSSGFVVEKCSNDNCTSTETVPMASTWQSFSETGFTWLPAASSGWQANTRYRITIYGGDNGIFRSDPEGLAMLDDASWEFKTSAAGDLCEIGAVVVSPGEQTATEKEVNVNFSAGAVSSRYECEELDCQNYDWSFSSSDLSKAEIDEVNLCNAAVSPLAETGSAGPVLINAETTGPSGNAVDDNGLLTISFSDPKIDSYWPSCDLVCLNAGIGATFNIDMNGAELESSGAVVLKSCQDAGCTPDELTLVSSSALYDESTRTLTITPADDLDPNTPYRVIISGEVESFSGSPLSTAAGSLAWEGDVSWTFITKEETCLVDRVEVEPADVTVNYVGATQLFSAVPYGSPDGCSATGQRLLATDSTWLPWTSSDENVASLLEEGNIQMSYELPAGCSASCLNEGSVTPVAVCGNGTIDPGEDCDGGVGCSTSCLKEGSTTTCGNNTPNDGEECDDGNTVNGDGCSSLCLNEGASSPNSICGNDDIEHSLIYGGEDCDGTAGCSSDCLNTGSEPAGVAVCGNGSSPEPGEDCDGGAGCSSTCQHTGNTTSTCGNNIPTDPGEDCDDGNRVNGDGCSSICLLEGSSENYSLPSICGDGQVGIGEECDLESGTLVTAPFAVAIVPDTAPAVVAESRDNTASSTITASDSFGETGEGVLTLECSCEADANCDTSGELYGCGQASCCFARPTHGDLLPADGEADVCRNTAVSVEFDQEMDVAAIQAAGTISLKYVNNGTTIIDGSNCPSGYNNTFVAYTGHNIFARAWHWLAINVLSIFGANAEFYNGCYVQTTLSSVTTLAGSQVYLNFNQALEAGGTYVLKVDGENEIDHNSLDNVVEGAVSINGVGLYEAAETTFTVGSEICSLDIVSVRDEGNVEAATNEFIDPSPGLFTADEEIHSLAATANHRNGAVLEEIQSTDSYSWTWSWASTISDSSAETNVVTTTDVDAQTTTATAAGLEGEEMGTATATITDTGDAVTGTVDLEAILCENLWPSTGVFEDTDDAPEIFGLRSPYSNFSFYYCRDQANSDVLLPELSVVETPTAPAGTDIFKEILFLVNGTSDALGVRVLPNSEYLSPMAWYQAQGFTGSPSETTVDGYEAIKDGNTYYVSAANYTTTGEAVYANIYVISFNEDAGDDAQAIVEQILNYWSFNAERNSIGDLEISDMNICRTDSAYIQVDSEYVSCESDKDCQDELGATYPSAYCDAEKGKLTRNLKRLTDARDIALLLANYGESNKHCSVTKNQECTSDDSCSGDEICVAEVPEIQSGTFLAAFTTSAWPSWSAELGNALGTALPTDPLNEFVDCPDGADAAYCWDSTAGTFTCNEGSHAYIYQGSGGEEYTLSVQLERQSGDWYYDLDTSSTDNATLYAEYGNGDYLADGFLDTGWFCNGGPWGTSTRCGDGVQGATEACEIGDVSTDACTDGRLNLACIDDGGTCRFQTSSEAAVAGAECVPFECGNGVLDAGEICDDGSMNGEYGYCGENCTLTGSFYCGDGSIAGGEECDCGNSTTAMDAGAWSTDAAHCSVPNGQYTSAYSTSCAFDCSFPGTTCGDGEVNGTEQCDNETDAWSGKICGADDNFASCTTDADCENTTCGAGYDACPVSSICHGGDHDGEACPTGGCGTGTCTAEQYQLSRYRTCNDDGTSADCSWNSWGVCLGGTQICGNGNVEGDEECDDGNGDNTDSCTTSCLNNVCGDGDTYIGYETCDAGENNGVVCTPDYSGTCSYCNTACQFTVVSGSYCGDEVAQTGEYCDGSDLPMYCFGGAVTPGARDYKTEVDCSNYLVAGYSSGDAYCQSLYSATRGFGSSYTCESVGVCDGGSTVTSSSTYLYNGAPCAAGGTGSSQLCGTTDPGVCAVPVCQDDCGETCPADYQSSSILIQSELAGATKQTETNLYSYLSGDSPDTATLFLPACSVGTAITADIDTTNMVPPSIDIVFVTDLSDSMNFNISGSGYASEPDRRIDAVVESMRNAIEDLFNSYTGTSGQMRIATVSYSYGDAGSDSDSTACVVNGSHALAWTDQTFTSEEDDFYDESNGIDSYLDRTASGTTMAAGLECARNLLETSSTADVKLVILFSDGEPTCSTLTGSCATTASSSTLNEVYDIVHDVSESIDSVPAKTYTAGLTSDSDQIGFMAHFSSDECGADSADAGTCSVTGEECSGTGDCRGYCSDDFSSCTGDYSCNLGATGYCQHDETRECSTRRPCPDYRVPCPDGGSLCDYEDTCVFPDGNTCIDTQTCEAPAGDDPFEDASDCSPSDFIEYAYAASTADGLNDMYQSIIDSILDISVGMVTNVNGVSTETTGTVAAGDDIVLPFPDGFNCDSTREWTIPVRLSFNGTGTVNISDIKLSFCPAEATVADTGIAIDLDSDDDGIPDSTDSCPDDVNTGVDADSDGIDSACDENDNPMPSDSGSTSGAEGTDTDSDGITDDTDNCPDAANYSQTDTDSDGLGDACDDAWCGNGVIEEGEVCDYITTTDVESYIYTPIFSESYCVKGNRSPEGREIALDCSEIDGGSMVSAADLGICEGGSRWIGASVKYFDGALCKPSESSSEWTCGSDWIFTAAGTCVPNDCGEFSCGYSEIDLRFFP